MFLSFPLWVLLVAVAVVDDDNDDETTTTTRRRRRRRPVSFPLLLLFRSDPSGGS